MDDKSIIFSKEKILKTFIFFLVIICIAIVVSKYLTNEEYRDTVDKRFFNKEIEEDVANSIEFNSDSNPTICAYGKYIALLSKNVLSVYDSSTTNCASLDMNIIEPYMSSDENNLVVAEKKGNHLYLVSNTNIMWENEVDGEIYRASVNKNGYVAVLIKNSTYKSVVILYDNTGKELFRTYLATSYALCAEISEDNKYIAIGQVDYSGTLLKSVVKLISVEKAKQNPQDAIVYTYESEPNKILDNLKFNTNDEVICMFDSYIQKINDLSDERICDINNEKLLVDVNLENNVVSVEKETSGLFSYQYQMNLKNTVGKSDNLYILKNDIPKHLKVSKKLICLNIMNEVRIVNSNGWLLKCYTTKNEIQDVVVGDSIVGIVYNNKIEVIGL